MEDMPMPCKPFQSFLQIETQLLTIPQQMVSLLNRVLERLQDVAFLGLRRHN